jgi:hypothetical protein
VVGGIFAVQYHTVLAEAGRAMPYWRAFLIQTGPWYVWVALLPLVLQMPIRWPACNGIPRFIVMNTAIGAVLGTVHLLVSARLLALLGDSAWPMSAGFPPGWGPVSMASMAGEFIIYWMLVGLTYVSYYHQVLDNERLRSAELKAKVVTAELTALRAQLCPHFLFNTLNSACGLIPSDPERAETMIARLSQLLRLALQTDGVDLVPLTDELEFARAYLDVEHLRFQERLRVTIDVAPGLQDALVPNFLLQPLVENAVHHAVAPSRGPCSLWLVVEQRGSSLVIEVRDDGPGVQPGALERRRGAIGLKTTRARLEHIYGSGYSLTVSNRTGGGAVAEVILPFRLAPDTAEVVAA